MAITTTLVPAGTPPYIQLSIAPTNGATVTAITLTRTIAGNTVATRVQPTTGPSPRVVQDYEADWDTNVVYTAVVTTSSGSETFTTGNLVLSPSVAWMIHPTTPALSCVLDTGSNATAGVVQIGQVTRPATTTIHEIVGSEFRLVTKSGPRAASRTQMTYATVTELERSAFTAMCRDQTPILFRIPAGFGWNFHQGYYDIGDTTEERFSPYGPEPRRNFTVPIERVDTPAGTQSAIRTWADVLAQNSSWANVSAGYATWTDVLTNTRR